jgi:hypothetical protein
MEKREIADDLLRDVEITFTNNNPNNKTDITKFIKVMDVIKSGVDGNPVFKVKASNEHGFKMIDQKEAKFLNKNFGINLVHDQGGPDDQ